MELDRPNDLAGGRETVLLAVTGMSPAVLTETVWALAHEPEPVIPHRIIAVTTVSGRSELERQLFQPSPRLGVAPWDALRAALAAAAHDLTGRLRFGTTADDLRVITATDNVTGRSRELADLRTPEDNEATADFLLEQVRTLVENPDNRLIASLAGGRKTMGALLYACLTLLGRDTDRLTHVLVNEPYDQLRDFWFPGQSSGDLLDSVGVPHPPGAARVQLADVPFVPLRNLFRRELGRSAGRFNALVAACGDQVRRHLGEDIRLVIRRSRTEIEVNGTRLRLAPREHVVLVFLAARAKAGAPILGAYGEAVDPLNEFRESLCAEAPSSDLSDWRHLDSLRSPFEADGQDLRRALSSLRDKLRRAGSGPAALEACLPSKGRFHLAVPGSLIELAP